MYSHCTRSSAWPFPPWKCKSKTFSQLFSELSPPCKKERKSLSDLVNNFVFIISKHVNIHTKNNAIVYTQQTFTYVLVTNRYIKIITHVTMWCRASRSLILAKTQPDSSIFSYYFVQKMVRVLTIYRLINVVLFAEW